MAVGTLTIQRPNNKAPRIVPGGDGEQQYRASFQWDGASTQSYMDVPFKYITGVQIQPVGAVPDDHRVVDTMSDGVITRDSNGRIQISRTDTTSSANFFANIT